MSKGPVPQMALKLLWYASPYGRAAADSDLWNELVMLRSLTGAMDRADKSGTHEVFRNPLAPPSPKGRPSVEVVEEVEPVPVISRV